MVSIENKYLRLSVDSKTGGISELIHKGSDDNLIKLPSGRPPLTIISLTQKGERIPLTPRSPTEITRDVLRKATRLTCRHESISDASGTSHPLTVVWTVTLADCEELVWELEITNQSSELTVAEVLFPYIQGVYLGETHTDDIIVYPHHAGELTINPIEEYTSERFKSFWRAQSIPEEKGYSREINYCGLASMQWLDYYDADGGLYFASHDSDFLLTGIRVEVGGVDDPWINFAFRKYLPIRPGESWSSNQYLTSLHSGDWHWGAKRYRQWIDQVISYLDIAPDFKEESALCPRYDFRYGSQIKHRFSEIPQMYDEAKKEGITHFFMAGWNRQGFDNNYPEFIPDMELGSSLELAQGIRYIREHGGMATFYINVRLFDVKSDYYSSLGQKWAIKDHQDRETIETYGPRSFTILCPASPEVRQWFADTAVWMVKGFGAKGIYLDQLGSATPLPCYDKGHLHPEVGHHGLFNQGYLELLKDVLQRAREYDPGAFLMIENCGDIYGSYVYANLTWNGEFYDEFFNLYKYTFPEYLQVNMVNPRRIPDKSERNRWFYQDVSRAFLLGSIFWAELGDRFGDEDDDLRAYLRLALALRQKAAPYFAYARFVDNEGLAAILADEIKATRWVAEDFELIACANPEGLGDTSIEVELGPTLGHSNSILVRNVGLDGEENSWSLRPKGARLCLPVHKARLSFLVLSPEA